MIKWELTAYVCNKYQPGDAMTIWAERDKKTGKTDWDELKGLASEGWELVSVTPVANYGSTVTSQIMYTFKRPIEEPKKADE